MTPFVGIEQVSVRYGRAQALRGISLDIPEHCIYAFIGPSGCGKTTLLRSINRLNDFIPGFHLEGRINIAGREAYATNDHTETERLRREIGMVFQHTNPLPMTIMQNMLLPVQEHMKGSFHQMRALAAEKLKLAALWDEVEPRLHKSAFSLSGGQQQRLCIARSLMLEPKLLLMDEPCSALDPVSTYKIEELLMELKKKYTIIIVTHNMEQAARIADYTAFFYMGEVVEANETIRLFSDPQNDLTHRYLTGRF